LLCETFDVEMGRKKKPTNEEIEPEPFFVEEPPKDLKKKEREKIERETSSEPELEPKRHDLDPDIQQLAYTFKIDAGLTQKLNDIMIEKRMNTWEQDLARLYEILKDAHTPAAMLNLKVKDMQKGTFVGKAKCGPRVRELARKHKLDKGAATKLEEAMSMREAMGKDVEKDIFLLDEHLTASNKPSALISMKLDSLRKGYNIGHCIYSREPVQGNTGPGVDGVVDKKRHVRVLGYTDADLNSRFASNDGGKEELMDEATVRRLMAAEKSRVLGVPPKNEKKATTAPSSAKAPAGKKSASRKKSPSSSRSRSRSRKRRRRSSSSSSRSRSRRKRSKSSKAARKKRDSSDSSSSRQKAKDKGKDKDKKEKEKEKGKKDKEKPKETDRQKEKEKEREKDKKAKDKAKEKDKEKEK